MDARSHWLRPRSICWRSFISFKGSVGREGDPGARDLRPKRISRRRWAPEPFRPRAGGARNRKSRALGLGTAPHERDLQRVAVPFVAVPLFSSCIMGVAIELFKVRIFEERAACGRSLVVKIGNKVGTSASHCLPRARPAINGCARPDLSRRQLPAQEMAICIKCCKISFSISRTGSRMRSLRDGVSMSARLCGVFIFCGVVAAGAGLARAVLRPASVNRIDFKQVDLVISRAPNDEAPANFQYFVGMFLLNRGNKEKSRDYLIRAAQSTLINKYNHILARKTLRDLKIPVPPPAVTSEKPETK